ncbi:MAG: hypothetical protein AAGM22_18770 [Acidobacteriota bacterium]
MPLTLEAQTSVAVDDQSQAVADGIQVDVLAAAAGYYAAVRSDDFIVTLFRLDASGNSIGAPVGVIEDDGSYFINILRTIETTHSTFYSERPTFFGPEGDGPTRSSAQAPTTRTCRNRALLRSRRSTTRRSSPTASSADRPETGTMSSRRTPVPRQMASFENHR